MRREIVEEPTFTEQLVSLGNISRIDDRLDGLRWALWLDAEDFPLVGTFKNLRVARVLGFDEPDLLVFFNLKLIDGVEKVSLLWIEAHEEDAAPDA